MSATNRYGFVSSTNTSPGSTVTPLTVPAAPTNVSLAQPAAGVNSVVATWNGGDKGGASSVTYTVSNGLGQTCTTTTGSCTLTGVGWVNMQVSVTPSNAAGSGAAQGSVNTVSVYTTPDAPSISSVVWGNQAAGVYWNPKASHNTSVYYVATAQPGGQQCSTSGTSCTIGSLNGYPSNQGSRGNGASWAYTITVTAVAASTPSGNINGGTSGGSSGSVQGNNLYMGMALDNYQYIKSPDGRWSLLHQSDGNLVWYGSPSVWATGTNNGYGASFTILQTDSNFVVYNWDNSVGWAANTSNGLPNGIVGAFNSGCVYHSNWGTIDWGTC